MGNTNKIVCPQCYSQNIVEDGLPFILHQTLKDDKTPKSICTIKRYHCQCGCQFSINI